MQYPLRNKVRKLYQKYCLRTLLIAIPAYRAMRFKQLFLGALFFAK